MSLSKSAKTILIVAAIAVLTSSAVYAYSEISDERSDSDPFAEYNIIIIDVQGGRTSGGGTYTKGSTATLSAYPDNGYSFDGWYNGTKLLSKSSSYNHIVKATVTVKAKYSIIHDASFTITGASSFAPTTITATSTYNVEISNRTWTFTDALSDKQIVSNTTYGSHQRNNSTHVSEGKAVKVTQTITYSDGYKDTSSQTIVIDQIVNKKFSWKYQGDAWYSLITDLLSINNKSTSFTWDLKYSNYYKYAANNIVRGYDFGYLAQYVTHTDPYIISLAKHFTKETKGWTDIKVANYVLKFVQAISYETDPNTYGQTEYWAFPYETLWNQKGDCEDTSILYAAIMKAMGYKTALIHAPGHLLAAIHLSGGAGSYTSFGGLKYYYCETTADSGSGRYNWANVGYINSSYSGQTKVVWAG